MQRIGTDHSHLGPGFGFKSGYAFYKRGFPAYGGGARHGRPVLGTACPGALATSWAAVATAGHSEPQAEPSTVLSRP